MQHPAPRTTAPRTTAPRTTAARTLAAGTLSGLVALGTVHAEDTASVEFSAPVAPKPLPHRVEILSDGTQYTGTADGVGRIDTHIAIELDVGLVGRIERWEVWVESRADVAPFYAVTGLRQPGTIEEIYPFGHRPRQVMGELYLPTEFSVTGALYCNVLADGLRAQGFGDAEIFAQERSVQVELHPELDYSMSGPEGNMLPPEVELPDPDASFNLACLAHEPTVSDDGPVRDPLASIAYANLAIAFDEQPGECPTEVMAQALFTSAVPGRFTVRLRDVYGHTSQPLELRMEEADRVGSNYVKVLEQGFVVGAPGGDGGAGGDKGGVKVPGGLGLEADALEEDPYPFELDPRPGEGRADDLADHEGDPNEHVNSVWVEIVDAGLGSVAETDHEEYRITCPPPSTTPAFVGPAELGTATADSAFSRGGVAAARARAR